MRLGLTAAGRPNEEVIALFRAACLLLDSLVSPPRESALAVEPNLPIQIVELFDFHRFIRDLVKNGLGQDQSCFIEGASSTRDWFFGIINIIISKSIKFV